MLDMETEISIDFGSCGELNDVPAYFAIEQDIYPAEPYSWGGGRGMETETIAYLKWIKLGGAKLSAEVVDAIIGADAIAYINDSAADEFERAGF